MMDSSLVEPCLNSLIKSRSGLNALNESQSTCFFLKPQQALSRVWLWCMADGSGDVSLLYT